MRIPKRVQVMQAKVTATSGNGTSFFTQRPNDDFVFVQLILDPDVTACNVGITGRMPNSGGFLTLVSKTVGGGDFQNAGAVGFTCGVRFKAMPEMRITWNSLAATSGGGLSALIRS